MSTPGSKKLKSFTYKLALLTALFVFTLTLFMQITQPAFAEPLSQDEIQALNQWTNWVADNCGSDTPAPGSGAPDGAQFPNLDPASMASSIDKFVKKNNSSSKLNGLGATIVAGAQHSNVSPFLIVAIAYKESGLANPSDFNVSHGSNSFGREATSSQPNFSGSHLWYKWSSVKASVDYTVPENQKAAGGGDMASYLRNQYGNAIDSSDLVSLFMKYAPPSENDTTQYIAQVKGWVSDMVGGAGGPSTSATGATQSCCPPGSGTSATGNSPTSLQGKTNKEKAFNFFLQEGLSPAQSAGVVANLQNESNVEPATGGSPSAGAFGIAQWTPGSKFSTDKRFNHVSGSDTALLTQLQVLWAEMNGKSSPSAGFTTNIVPALKKINDPGDAADYFRANFERCDTSYSSCSDRATVGKQIFRELAHGSNAGGVGGTVSSGPSGDCSSSTTPSDSSGYKNPLRDVKHLRPERIDMGVDYGGSGPVYALGDGTVMNLINSGWNYGGFDAFISVKLSSGPAQGKYSYVAEACPPVKGLHIGQKVTADTVICNIINPADSGIETGWGAPPGSGEALARTNGGYTEGRATALGENYNDLLVKLGAPSGTQQPKMGSLPKGWPTWK